MFATRYIVLAAFALAAGWAAHAQEAAKEAPTSMLQRGKLILSDDLTKPGPGWQGKNGTWEVVGGAWRGAERTEDMHGAVRRHPAAFERAVIQYAFKLTGARQTSLSLNAAKGHVCRVIIRPTGFTVQKDKDKKTGEKGKALDTCDVTITPGEWHTLVVELSGKEMLARLDGKHVAYGSSDGLDVPKANLGFTVSGASASFKELRVWEGTPAPGWDAARAKLLAGRKGGN